MLLREFLDILGEPYVLDHILEDKKLLLDSMLHVSMCMHLYEQH